MHENVIGPAGRYRKVTHTATGTSSTRAWPWQNLAAAAQTTARFRFLIHTEYAIGVFMVNYEAEAGAECLHFLLSFFFPLSSPFCN